MSQPQIVIALDGHSSCGKSTMAKALAKALGYVYIDTGAMYRTVTLFSLREGLWLDETTPDLERLRAAMSRLQVSFVLNPETSEPEACLNGENVEREIRSMEVSSRVSYISAIDFVREAMTKQQQEMGQKGGIVMDGRDIGTTVFPHAELKVFVTASAQVRAQRRFDELRSKGDRKSTFEEVLANLEERDRIDSSRAVSPLRKAEDALLLDNSEMTRAEQLDWLIEKAKSAIDQSAH